MRVLGRELVPPFDDFWERFKAEIPVLVEHIEEGHSTVFGLQGMDLTAPQAPAWASMPDDDLAYHVAHELTHIIMRERGFPETGRGPDYPEDSAEARLGGDLEEMVLHPPLDALVLPLGFKRDFIQQRMLSGALNGLGQSPAPEWGTPWFFTWALRYCGLKLELPEHDWLRVEAVYRERSPEGCQLGDELVFIMREVGWGTREQALEAMVKCRDTLGLGVEGRVLVLDPVSGRVL